MTQKEKESYYKILGTTANIGNARIKEKYIQALKQHPPETDPEGFERVRKAYETLKDPEKRKQYDLMRKYGSNVEDLLAEASFETERDNFKKAEQLLLRANKISPNNPSIMMGLMVIAIETEDFEKVDKFFESTIKAMPEYALDEIVTLYGVKVDMLLNHGFADEALETLEEMEVAYPEQEKMLAPIFARYYVEEGKMEEAWEQLTIAIPAPGEESVDDIYLFMIWSNFMLDSEKWNEKAKVQSRFRKLLKNLTDEQEKEYALDLLHESYNEYYEGGRFREAEFFIDLLLSFDKNSELREMKNKTKSLARVQKDIDRLADDEDVFPLIFLQAFDWFYKDIIPSAELDMMINNIPPYMLAELEEETEYHAAGIIRLRKRYPSIYKHFKEDWDQLFDELTEGMNRQMKRDLRKMS